MDPHLHIWKTSPFWARAAWSARQGLDVAVFRNSQDEVSSHSWTAARTRAVPLSQGIVFGTSVACPLHNWTIGLCDGQRQRAR